MYIPLIFFNLFVLIKKKTIILLFLFLFTLIIVFNLFLNVTINMYIKRNIAEHYYAVDFLGSIRGRLVFGDQFREH